MFATLQAHQEPTLEETIVLNPMIVLENDNDYFRTRFDARHKTSFSSLQKCTSAIRQLGYGNVPDSLDEYLNMSDRTSRESLQEFCEGVIRLYGKEYLRRPTAHDVTILYNHHATRHGFPGMLGSVDSIDLDSWRRRSTMTSGDELLSKRWTDKSVERTCESGLISKAKGIRGGYERLRYMAVDLRSVRMEVGGESEKEVKAQVVVVASIVVDNNDDASVYVGVVVGLTTVCGFKAGAFKTDDTLSGTDNKYTRKTDDTVGGDNGNVSI
ncbi:hypothetical protein QVD17_28805 [Tagetes erecta]|uniref:Uncharacterized protein n=1 Tax=Tagetes erecta TaxID=13708 RepID=A0AAD8KB15_TARER|nr:hypothetical protein QVD17_28805 [Tagetes erecta]